MKTMIRLVLFAVLLSGCAAPPVQADPELEVKGAADASVQTVKAQSLLLYAWEKSTGQQTLTRMDPATGEPWPGTSPLTLSERSQLDPKAAFATQIERLVVGLQAGEACDAYAGGARCLPAFAGLARVDLQAWQAEQFPFESSGWLAALSVRPDGAQAALAVSDGPQVDLLLVELEQGAELARLSLPFIPEGLSYVLEGSSIALWGSPPGKQPGLDQPEAAQVLLVDGSDLSIQWQASLDGLLAGQWCQSDCEAAHGEQRMAYRQPGGAWAADGQRLYLADAATDAYFEVDFAARRTARRELQAVSWFERLLARTAGSALAKGPMDFARRTAALSPDGRWLALSGVRTIFGPDANGEWQETGGSLGLTLVDPASGRTLAAWEARQAAQAPGWGLRFAPGGQFLLLDGAGQALEGATLVQAPELKLLHLVAQWQLTPVQLSDGRLGWAGLRYEYPNDRIRTHLALLDPVSFQPSLTWKTEGQAVWWVSP